MVHTTLSSETESSGSVNRHRQYVPKDALSVTPRFHYALSSSSSGAEVEPSLSAGGKAGLALGQGIQGPKAPTTD
jgi:hypothetical protein